MGRPGCLLEAPGAPREARPPKAAQRHSKETVWVVWGCLLEVSGPPLGGLRAPKGTPKSLQGRGQYEASDLKLTQTKTSELKLHNFFPQGHWSSRSRGGIREAKTILFQLIACSSPQGPHLWVAATMHGKHSELSAVHVIKIWLT